MHCNFGLRRYTKKAAPLVLSLSSDFSESGGCFEKRLLD